MAAVRAALTEDDLRMLVKGPTADDRALAAHKLCRAMDRDNLSRQELAQAHEILRLMAKDATELVRRALAITLKASPVLPRYVALKLARDVVREPNRGRRGSRRASDCRPTRPCRSRSRCARHSRRRTARV